MTTCLLAWAVVDQLAQFFTSARGLQFLALWITLDGLLCELFGVFVLLSPDYERVRDRLNTYLDFNRVAAIEDLQQWMNNEQVRLRQDPSFATAGQFRNLDFRCEEDRRFLQYVLFIESYDRPTIDSCEFVAQVDDPSFKDILLRVETDESDKVIVDDDTFCRQCEKAINRSYYRQGALLIILGFILIIVATVLQIVAFGLTENTIA